MSADNHSSIFSRQMEAIVKLCLKKISYLSSFFTGPRVCKPYSWVIVHQVVSI